MNNPTPLRGVYVATYACVGTLWTKGALSPPLCSKRGPTYTCGGNVDGKREEKMKEELERLFKDWCFEQNIDEDDSISMQDVSDFFDYVEMMTDLFEV